MKAYSFILISIFWSVTYAQNFITNGSCEQLAGASCAQTGPTDPGTNGIPNLTGWKVIANSYASPDAFHQCSDGGGYVHTSNVFGTQGAQDGLDYIGICLYTEVAPTNYREYIVNQLNAPLVAGQLYELRFYVSLADNSIYATNDFHVYFSNSFPTIAINPLNPYPSGYYSRALQTIGGINGQLLPNLEYSGGAVTNKTGWTLLTFNYTAVGGETFVSIGNSSNPATTTVSNTGSGTYLNSYYYFDNFSLVPIIPLGNQIELNTIVCTEENVKLDWSILNTQGVSTIELQKSTNAIDYTTISTLFVNDIDNNSFRFVDYTIESVQTWYRLKIIDNSLFEQYTAAVSTSCKTENELIVFPNPSDKGFAVLLPIELRRKGEFKLFDPTGRIVFETEWDKPTSQISFDWDQQVDHGIYFIQVTNENIQLTKELVKI